MSTKETEQLTATEQLLKKYPLSVIHAVRQNIGDNYDEHDTSRDETILNMSRAEVLNRTLTWHGLIGYGATIRDWVGGVYGIILGEDHFDFKDASEGQVKYHDNGK